MSFFLYLRAEGVWVETFNQIMSNVGGPVILNASVNELRLRYNRKEKTTLYTKTKV